MLGGKYHLLSAVELKFNLVKVCVIFWFANKYFKTGFFAGYGDVFYDNRRGVVFVNGSILTSFYPGRLSTLRQISVVALGGENS
jgi:hypothetical protein